MAEPPDGDASPGVQTGQTPLQRDVERFLRQRNADRTRSQYRWQLEKWLGWLDRYEKISRVEDVDSAVMERYAERLTQRVRGGDRLSGSGAHTYYSYVSAFLDWCREREKLPSNPARVGRATGALPEDRSDEREQQFWSPEDRRQLLEYVDRRAHEALDADERTRAHTFRNRALVYVLALTGARGAEVFRDSEDSARDGLQWRGVDLDGETIRVLGKSRDMESIGLAPRVIDALDRHKRVQDPPSMDWPVFPTQHRPTLAGLEDGEAPPAITVSGARSVMERLSEAAGLSIDGEYLKPHGGRRGIGGTIYRENPGFAQKLLRHDSLATTNDTYEDIEAVEVGRFVGEVTDSE